MVEAVSIGIIGAGKVSRAHLIALRAISSIRNDLGINIDVKAVADINKEQVRLTAEDYGIDKWTTDWHDIIDNKDIDMIIVLTPPYMHKEIVVEAAKNGKNIFYEKPLAINGSDALEMWEAVKSYSVINMVGFNYRRLPSTSIIKELIDSSKLGAVYHVDLVFYEDFAANGEYGWRYVKELSSGGVLMDLGAHLIDLIHYFTNSTVSRVSISAANLIPERDGHKVDVEDWVSVLFRTENGITGQFESSWAALGRKNMLRIEVYGSSGSAVFDLERPNEVMLYLSPDEPKYSGYRRVLLGPPHPYGDFMVYPAPGTGMGYEDSIVNEYYEFFNGIITGKNPSPNFYNGYLANKVIDMIYESKNN